MPGFSAVAVLTVALAIGMNTAMFSVIDALLLKPLPYRDVNRIAVVWTTWPQKGFPRLPLFIPEFLDLQRNNRVFERMAGFKPWSANLTGAGEPEHVDGERASASFFSILGVPPVIGRTFTAEEDTAGGNHVVVLGYGFWRSHFAGDPHVLGRTLALDGVKHTVIGVMPEEFRLAMSVKLKELNFPPVDFWTPLAFTRDDQTEYGNLNLFALGRLKPGVTMAHAQSETASLVAAHFKANDLDLGTGTRLEPLAEVLHGTNGAPLWILFAATGCVLLIACGNLAGLMLARGAAMQREIGIRLALGAGRGAIVRQLLVLALLLALCGGALGAIASVWAARLFIAISPADLQQLAHLGLDARILAFALGASIFTGLLFALAPARRLSHADLNAVLKDSARSSASRGQQRVRGALVVAQVAFAVVVLSAAVLLIRSLGRVLATDAGFARSHVLTMDIPLPQSRYPDARSQAQFFEQALQRVQGVSGVDAAALVETPPLMPAAENFIIIEGRSEDLSRLPLATRRFASPDYLRVMNIPLLKGRWFTAADRLGQPKVAVVDDLFARAQWPGDNPIGRHIRVGGGSTGPWTTIIGVVAATHQYGLDSAPRPGIYLSYLQDVRGKMSLVARTSADPLALAAPMRDAVRTVDRDQPVANVRTMDELVMRSVAGRRFQTVLLGSFAGTALFLTALGVFGLLSWMVTERTREIGVRIALGAELRDVLRLVGRRTVMLVGLGLAIGLAGSLAITRLIGGLVYQVRPSDPLTLLVVATIIAAVGLLASALPAWRAAQVDPAVALRSE